MNLPLYDGKLILDNSTLDLLRCPRELYLVTIRKLELAGAKAGRNFGSTLHHGCEARYKNAGTDAPTPDTIATANEAMNRWLQANPQPEEEFRNFDHACRILAFYNNLYEREPFHLLANPSTGKPIVEQPFLVQFATVNGIDCWYSGKIDLAIENNDGCWVLDHKTTFQFGKGWEKSMARDSGQLGYVWALSKLLKRKVNGYIIDGIRVRRPGSERSSARRRNSEFGEPTPSTPPVDATDFVRIPHFIQDSQLAQWEKSTIQKIALFINLIQNDIFPEFHQMCVRKYGPCDFYDACSLPPESQEMMLTSQHYRTRDWSPLNRIKEETVEEA